MKNLFNLSLLFITLTLFQPCNSQTITTSSLLDELTNLERLIEFPEKPYVVKHFSSFDRSSLGKSRDQEGWFANSDGFGKEPIPNFEKILEEPGEDGIGKYLICDVEGPGAIIRTWTARITGNVAVYLDNNEEPIYDGPANPFFIKSFEAMLNIEDPPYSGIFTQYLSNYFPIPFKKRCRVEWTGNKNDLHFYYLQIRQYSEGTPVQTFTTEDIKTNTEKIKTISNVFSNPGENLIVEGETIKIPSSPIRSGSSTKIAELNGSKSIHQLMLKVDSKDMIKALRQNVLRIVFDDFSWGQVQAPLGDFFCSAPGISPVNSIPFTVTPDNEMICRFVMPFKKSCRIYIDNFSGENISIKGSITFNDYQWENDKSMYFYAKWRIDHGLIANTKTPQDLVYLMAQGTGRYVGSTAFLMNPANAPVNNGNWWGEGDEKIFIDNNKFPVVFGTGSEDYYGYAWSSSRLFEFPFLGQPKNDGPGNRGFVTNYRYHITDDLLFKNSLSFFMELFHHDSVPDFVYGRIAYYYGLPGIFDDHKVISPDDVRIPEMPESWSPKAFRGSEGFTFYPAEDVLTSGENTSIENGYLWADNKVLVSKPKQKGEKITFKISGEMNGRNAIILTTKQSPEGGKFTASLNKKSVLKEAVDLQTEFHTISRNVALMVNELRNTNELVLTFEGEPGQEVGLDFIWVK